MSAERKNSVPILPFSKGVERAFGSNIPKERRMVAFSAKPTVKRRIKSH